MTNSQTSQTRLQILDAAERLFGEYGHDNTSMRQITGEAGVNLSAVNYHFGSKDGLVQAVFQRRVAALNKERLNLLDGLELKSNGGPLKPSQIVEAFFGPLVRHACVRDATKPKAFVPLLERSMSDPGGFIRAAIIDEHSEVLSRFKHALICALPDVPEIEMIWRFHFMLGATSYAITGADILRQATSWMPSETSTEDPTQQLLDRLLSFLLGGLRAALPGVSCSSQDTVSTPHIPVDAEGNP